jgi:hypothetical protein
MIPRPGDGLYTNRRRKLLTMTEDTSLGAHDTLMAACDSERYILLGVKEYHDNCTDNLFAAMQGLGPDAAGMPEPAQPVHEHPVDADRHAVVRPADRRSPATTSTCAPSSTASSPCRPARRTSCRSTARPASRPRRTTRSLAEPFSAHSDADPSRSARTHEQERTHGGPRSE